MEWIHWAHYNKKCIETMHPPSGEVEAGSRGCTSVLMHFLINVL